MSVSGSDLSEPAEDLSQPDEPTGSGRKKSVEHNSDNDGTHLAPKRHGRDDSSQPKRARMDFYHKFIDPNKSPVDAGAKEPEDLGSVRLRLGGFPVTRSESPSNAALRVHAPSVLSMGLTKGRQANTADDRTDPGISDSLKRCSKRIIPQWEKFQFQTMSLLYLVRPTRSTLFGHVASNLRTS